MQISKAIITAAGANQRTLPLQTVVDRNGEPKSALRIIIEEAIEAGCDSVCVVVHPGDQGAFQSAAGDLAPRVRFVEQAEPRGYGHAVWCAKEFTVGEPFLLLVGDHLYVSRSEKRCARQLVEAARTEACAVSGVQATHESKLTDYGAVGGRLVPGQRGLYTIHSVLGKPTPTEAEQSLDVPGLRAGHYLCFFGMHVLTAAVMETLDREVAAARNDQRVLLTPALSKLAASERYLALEIAGRRYDIGAKYGILTAQLALSLDGADREMVLAGLVELLASRSL